jgi:DNA mismatch repair protein MutS2
VTLLATVPSPISEISRATLDWDRLLELVAEYATARVTREWLLTLRPSSDPEWARREHRLIAEMRTLTAAGVRPALGGLFDATEVLAKARIEGAALEAEELRSVLALLDDITAWQAAVFSPSDDLRDRIAGLQELSQPLQGTQLGQLADSLRRRMNPDGSLADDASPDLRRIRRDLERQQRVIEDSLRHALRSLSEGGSTQDDLITIRGERFVIPVKAEWKRRVAGVVHGASSSGQTVYLEPLETIEANNELIRLLDEEQAEIHRIFLAMTRQLGAQATAIAAGATILAQVDALQARARFAQAYNCIAPEFAPPDAPELHPELSLDAARHPLLERRLRDAATATPNAGRTAAATPTHVVPLTLALLPDARQLIISGPNTGGKTVALKTTGLLAMMAQAGIPVPAERMLLPVFRRFLADIGDAQSIEQNLSTFSSHIVNLNRIAAIADEHSLVLLDELGSATDPEEGAALAAAIADYFRQQRCWCIISTHHTSLKVYAAQTPGVLNAAVGFDERTLAPTYELRLGVPGASAGINIAERLGLNGSITSAARARLSHQTEDIANFLDQLHAQLTTVATERDHLRQREQEVAREKNRLEVEGLKEWRLKVRELEQQMQSLLRDFEFRMREAVQAVGDRAAKQKLSRDAERRIAQLRREFSDQFNATAVAQHTGADKGDAHAQPHIVRHVTVGDTVRLKSLGKPAIVQRQIDGSSFEVSIGPMKMRVPREDIAEVLHSGQSTLVATPLEAARRSGVTVTVASSSDDLRPEINVIGKTVAEASGEVESYIDRAFLAGLPRVRIVHGSGMGVLRRALRDMLGRHPHVALVSEATQAEGGGGATVVDLRQ